ncbi:MAG: hypothetical protein HZB68_01755, partial [Candidatus Aenigmarchaeota archaeon]|nr:hypothetical protein [Candidatus Aenigmarchaeota archaeon]
QEPYDGNDIKCRPDGIPVEKFLSDTLEKRNSTQFLSMADGKYDLLQTFDKGGNIVKAKGYVSMFNWALNISIIVAIAISALIFFVAGMSLKSSLRWIGASFAVSGFVVISIPRAAKMAMPIIVDKASQAIEFLKIDPLNLINPLLSSIESKAAILLFLGAACLLSSFIPIVQKFTIGKHKADRKL